MTIMSFLKHKVGATEQELEELVSRYGDPERYNTTSLIQALAFIRMERFLKELEVINKRIKSLEAKIDETV